MKKSKIILACLVIIIFVIDVVLYKGVDNTSISDNTQVIDMIDEGNLNLKQGEDTKLSITFSDQINLEVNNFYKWSSSDSSVCTVDDNGIVHAKKAGEAYIKAKWQGKTIKTKVTVYDIKSILIVVGDSRMDNFKDDNNFMDTSKYEVKYIEKTSLISNFEKMFVVSLSGMRYNWLAGENDYKDDNATKYVEEIIKEYEEKTNNIHKYDIKILFNLGVNDLEHKYLKDDSPAYIASKYLHKLDNIMNNEWKSDIINNIDLNMITLFPVNDEQVECYFPGRYDKDIVEFNNYIKSEYKGSVCDAYNDLDFNANVFRPRSDKTCASRDGLHFSKEFNQEKLYPYLVNDCAKK